MLRCKCSERIAVAWSRDDRVEKYGRGRRERDESFFEANAERRLSQLLALREEEFWEL